MNKTAQQQLGEVIRVLRKNSNLELSRAANLANVPAGLFVEWEQGTRVPDGDRWDRLKNAVLHGLRPHESLWRQARADYEIARSTGNIRPTSAQGARNNIAGLSQRPFEKALKTVAEPPKAPAPTKPHSRSTTPTSLRGDGFDLQAAYAALSQLPPGWNTKAAAQSRAAYAKELVQQGLRTVEVIDKVKEKFKVGISGSVVAAIREELKKKGKVYKARSKAKPKHWRSILTPLVVPQKPAEAPSKGDVNEEELSTAVSLLKTILPNLSTFSISVDSNGEWDITYSCQEKKMVQTVVETLVKTGGSLKLR